DEGARKPRRDAPGDLHGADGARRRRVPRPHPAARNPDRRVPAPDDPLEPPDGVLRPLDRGRSTPSGGSSGSSLQTAYFVLLIAAVQRGHPATVQTIVAIKRTKYAVW